MLVVTPEPMPREGLLGYMLRVTEMNAYDSPWHIYRHAGLQQGEMNTACLPAHKLAAVLGQDAARLEAMSYTRTNVLGDTTYRIGAHDLGSGMNMRPFRLTQQGLCPLCVRESGYIDMFWDLRIATACPFHRCRVLMHCPTCLAPLRQFRPAPLRCKCGADLALASLERADAAEVAMMRVLYARLHDEHAILEGSDAGLPIHHLLALPLRSLMMHVFRLGAFVLNERHGKSSAQDSVLAAAKLLSDWPNGLSAHLRGQMIRRRPEETNFLKFYDRFYQQFARTSRKHLGQEILWIRQAFLEFGVKEWNGEAVDTRLVAQTNEQKGRFNLRDLARALRVDSRTLDKWLRAGVIHEADYVQSESRRFGFERDTLGAVAAPGSGTEVLETRVAAAYLRIPVSALQFLKENCLIGARDPRLQRTGYFRADLDRIRRQLLEKAQPLPLNAPIDPKSVLFLGRFLKFSHPREKTAKGRLLAALLTGTIQALGRTGDELATILLRRSDLKVLSCEISNER